MARYRTLFESRGIAVDEYRCVGHGSEEEAGTVAPPRHSIAFPLYGAFRKHLGHRVSLASVGTAVFFHREEEYRTSHPLSGGDGGLVLRIDDGALREILDDLGAADLPEPTVEMIVAPTSALRLRQLFGALRGGALPRLDLEESVLGLLAEVLPDPASLEDDPSAGPATRCAHRRAVRRVLELCAERFRDPLSLEEIGREAAYSPFHLCRVFKRSTGITIHRYINRLRLTASLDRTGSLGDLTGLALELGFCSHAHFTTAFRREFGEPPSRLLKALQTRGRG